MKLKEEIKNQSGVKENDKFQEVKIKLHISAFNVLKKRLKEGSADIYLQVDNQQFDIFNLNEI